MPLRVHCPSGCIVRMPSKRAGKVTRCPECKASIRLNKISKLELKSDKSISIDATFVEPTSPTSPPHSQESLSTTEPLKTVAANEPEDKTPAPKTARKASTKSSKKTTSKNKPRSAPKRAANKKPRPNPNPASETTPKQPTPDAQRPRLGLPGTLSPIAIQKTKDEHKAKLKEILDTPEPVEEFKRIEITPTKRRKRKRRRRSATPPPVVAEVQKDLGSIGNERTLWEDRVRKSNSDRVVLSRFFAISLCVVAVINMFPAFYFWHDWYQQIDRTPLPRWIYLQVFVAAIHVVYAVFLFQVPDWSAMRAVSFAMLAIAFAFGLVSTGLLMGGGQGVVAGFLGLSYVMVQRAAIWCVAMLCLATLMSYLGGRESSNWQRAEQLLEEILTGSPLAPSEA